VSDDKRTLYVRHEKARYALEIAKAKGAAAGRIEQLRVEDRRIVDAITAMNRKARREAKCRASTK